MEKYIFEVLDEYASKRSAASRVSVLKDNDSPALQDVIRGSMDESIVWRLPKGSPPYVPNKPESVPSNLKRENTKFRYLVKGGTGGHLEAARRENIFIGILESVHPKDAKIVINMINKKPVTKGLTRAIVDKAFPGLIKR